MTSETLAAVLRHMAERVEKHDSFEGSIQYLMPTTENVPDDTYTLVQASYRIGNTDGQGGVRLIGEEI
jgi:hypothetical protein